MLLQMLFGLIVSLILFLGFGYLILVFANKEKKGMKNFGLVIGWAIVAIAVISFLSGILGIWAAKDMYGMNKRAPMTKMMMK